METWQIVLLVILVIIGTFLGLKMLYYMISNSGNGLGNYFYQTM